MLLTKLKIEFYRGIKSVELELDETTVLVGENNSGKTSILHALRACLSYLRAGGRSSPFDEFDFHLEDPDSDPTTAEPISITLTFEERVAGEWGEEITRQLGGDGGVIAFIGVDEHSRIMLKVGASYSDVTQDIETNFEFLDAAGAALPLRNKSKLNVLQTLRPLFYLSALRDAGKEFSRNSQFWSPFVKNSQISPDQKREIERQLEDINAQIIEAHGTFKGVRDHLANLQGLVNIGGEDVVSVDAVPARVFDMLNRTQVSISSSSGAKLPIGRHGEGTQSLSVLMLFDAFLKSELSRRTDSRLAKPIVALEEPEAHLHPNAARALWKTIKSINGQKVIATHSGDLLSQVEPISIRRLFKVNGETKVGKIAASTFRTREKQKFDFLVRRTRGELFFARCWLMGEGETESILIAGAAEVLNIDLEQAGVRFVEYRQGDISYFLDAANALGISWHLLAEADAQGVADQVKAKAVAPGGKVGSWRKRITSLDGTNTLEMYMAANGFLNVYEQQASAQKKALMTAQPGDANYIKQIVECLPDKSKTQVAHLIVDEFRAGKDVPEKLKSAILKATVLARG